MGKRVPGGLFTIGCVTLIAAGTLPLLFALQGALILKHNEWSTCGAIPPPPGAIYAEAGLGGAETAMFPVAGVMCTWNRPEGGTFDTLVPDWDVTLAGWIAAVTLAPGIAGLTVAKRRRKMSRGAEYQLRSLLPRP